MRLDFIHLSLQLLDRVFQNMDIFDALLDGRLLIDDFALGFPGKQ